MSSPAPLPAPPRGPRGLRGEEGRRLVRRLRVVAGALLLCWAAAWAGLALASASHRWSLAFAVTWIVVVCLLVAAALRHPRAGGVLLLLAGMAAAAALDDPTGRLALATPAVVLGAVHVLLACIAPEAGAGDDDPGSRQAGMV